MLLNVFCKEDAAAASGGIHTPYAERSVTIREREKKSSVQSFPLNYLGRSQTESFTPAE